jgi:ribonuclease J
MIEEQKIQLIPLGGLGEFGKNMVIVAIDDDWIIIDSGSAMPEDGMLGIDVVIPDFSILFENQEKIRGLVLTHGHEPHMGALPYLLEQINVPIYGTKMTLAMARFYLNEYDYFEPVEMTTLDTGVSFQLGKLTCELIHVYHDVYGASGVAISTKSGWVINTGDFKIDYTPCESKNTDLDRLAAFGREGVFALMLDSANAEHKGSTRSESEVGEQIARAIRHAKGRVVVHLYVTDLVRIQQVLSIAEEQGRRVSIPTEQLLTVMERAESAGALNYSRRNIGSGPKRGKAAPILKPGIVLLASVPGQPYLGPLSGESGQRFQLEKDDTVILTGSYHAGTEKTLIRTIDMMYRQGAEQVHEMISRGLISSHAGQDELKLVLSLTKPKYVIPVHGEMRHLIQTKALAQDIGWKAENVFVLDNGDVLELGKESATIVEKIPAGKVLVDGLGVGDIGNVVLKDRKVLSQDGVIIVAMTIRRKSKKLAANPEIVSRGFVYVKESESLIQEITVKLNELVETQDFDHYDPANFRNLVKDVISKLLYDKTRRRPMVLPVILFV